MHNIFAVARVLVLIAFIGCSFLAVVGCNRSHSPDRVLVALGNSVPRFSQSIVIPIINPYQEDLNLEGIRVSCACSAPQFAMETVRAKSVRTTTITIDTTKVAEAYPAGGKVTLVPLFQSQERKRIPGIPVDIEFKFKQLLRTSNPAFEIHLSANEDSLDLQYDIPVHHIVCSKCPAECDVVFTKDTGKDVTMNVRLHDPQVRPPAGSTILLSGLDISGAVVAETTVDLLVPQVPLVWTVDDYFLATGNSLEISIPIHCNGGEKVSKVVEGNINSSKVRLHKLAVSENRELELSLRRIDNQHDSLDVSISVVLELQSGKEEHLEFLVSFESASG